MIVPSGNGIRSFMEILSKSGHYTIRSTPNQVAIQAAIGHYERLWGAKQSHYVQDAIRLLRSILSLAMTSGSIRFILTPLAIALTVLLVFCSGMAFAEKANDIETKETWWVAEEYAAFAPKRIAVLPMENLSLETDTEEALYQAVYSRLTEKGYIKISRDKVESVMKDLGIQTAGQLSGISPERLGKVLNCDAVFTGRIDQSGTVHMGVYDALAVSCSLKLVDCKTAKVLWLAEQWRAAHRQWQADPINLLLNIAIHEKASRSDRVTWLVSEMLKTLPAGPVQAVDDNLLEQAAPIKADE
jgi:hypothetical protein